MSKKNILYNGIEIDEMWPPPTVSAETFSATDAPYLSSPPETICIDVGRQLFIDDFLIEFTDCERVFHKPNTHPSSPVLSPETQEELDNGNCPMAAPFNDGVWYDPKDNLFKMWYMPGWFHTIALAQSTDGIHWNRPELDIYENTNLVWAPKDGYERDGSLVWLDLENTNENERYKLYQFYRYYGDSHHSQELEASWLHTSKDGIHWSTPVETTPVGDNTSFFYNPFRDKWCMSIRRTIKKDIDVQKFPHGLRARFYKEASEFLENPTWDQDTDEVLWQLTDSLDLPDAEFPEHGVSLYDLNAVAYESIMIGLFGIYRGPENPICQENGIPKLIDLEIGFSRDGFHFTRPDRTPFLASSRKTDDWDRAYLHAVGGICLIVNDLLYFYYTGFSGNSPNLEKNSMGVPGRYRNAMYAGASVGLAILRRDGFASLNSPNDEGIVQTRPLEFSGKYMFVNGDFSMGSLRVELLDQNNQVLDGYTKDDCHPITIDTTKSLIRWKNHERIDLENYGQPIKIRFHLKRSSIYSFWISQQESGESNGYVAAGGPGFQTSRDVRL
jgi:hypothetical protein